MGRRRVSLVLFNLIDFDDDDGKKTIRALVGYYIQKTKDKFLNEVFGSWGVGACLGEC